MTTSLYGPTGSSGTVSSSNLTTLYSGGTGTVPGNNLVVPGVLVVNGCSILTNCTSFNLLPTTATTINFGNDATTLSIGAATGTTTINNQLATANYTFPVADGLAGQILTTNGAGVLTFASGSLVGKNYDISASTTTGGANFNLNSNLPSTDTVKFANGSGITVVATDANTITISNVSPGTTYTIDASTTTGGANFNLVGSDLTTDTIKFSGSGATTVTRTSANEITISSTDANTTYTIDASATTGGANFNLVGSDLTTDTIKLAGSGATTVTQTSANEITISSVNTNTTYDFNASSTTGGVNLNLVGSDLTTDTVKLSNGTGVTVSYVSGTEASVAIGQDVATTASPIFAGGTFGNITIAVLDDNTITTTTGDLNITALANTNTVNLTSTAASPVIVTRGTATTSSVVRALTLLADSTGTPAVGFGATLDYEIESAPGTFKRAGSAAVEATDLTVGNENFDYRIFLMQDGATYTEKFRVASEGAVRTILTTASTNSVSNQLYLQAQSTGTPAVGFGNNITYELEDTTGNIIETAYLANRYTDVTAGAEKVNFRFVLKDGGASPTQRLVIDSSGDQLITGSQTSSTPVGIGGRNATNDFWHIGGYAIGGASDAGALEIATANNGTEPIYVRQYSGNSNTGNVWPWGNTIARTLTLLDASGNTALPGTLTLNGSTSGSTTFSVPATGSTLTYVLPGTAGAANTVLTNDGSGNLTWALPGGGGSTFGNVSIGVVTDNTISTTTGDLDITSNTGVINLDTYTAFTDNRLTTATTSTITLDILAIATYQSASYTITIKNTVTGATQFTKIDLLHDGTTAYINQYSNMASVADLSTFSATISGANAVLQITPASANSTQFTYNRIATKV